jgi:3-deoxy-D-manno-octulosonate 8-phosphate phosphatase (KDO 8-P phosphatase)
MSYPASEALERARRVKLMVLDVDGVLTDGTLWYGPAGEAMKAFHAADGHGIKLLAASGVRLALLSGRNSPAVSARAAELGIVHVLQGVPDKASEFEALGARLGVAPEASGYMGDDVVDLPVLVRCGFACAPREAPEIVRKRAHYVASAAAGRGAVREVCEYIMRAQDTLERALREHLA